MQEPFPVDLFATKGVEYLLVIGFLAALVLFWRMMSARGRVRDERTRPLRPRVPGAWFRTLPELYYHPGHSWASPGPDGLVTVGVDDFAQQLIGIPTAVDLPAIGDRLEQGARGTRVQVGSKSVDLLSPVDGEVVARNAALRTAPDLINRDPYGAGWLVKVAPTRLRSDLSTLLHKVFAASWMEATEGELRRRMSGELGTVLQDGGVPVSGIARSIAGEDWDVLAREFLLGELEQDVAGETGQ